MAYTFTATLEIVACPACHMDFGVPDRFAKDYRESHMKFYCPVGHSMSWGQQTDLEMAKKQRDEALRRATQLSGLLIDEQDQHRRTERRLRSTRGVVTKTKQRIVAGLCPKCHAKFPDLKHHMTADHPGYAG